MSLSFIQKAIADLGGDFFGVTSQKTAGQGARLAHKRIMEHKKRWLDTPSDETISRQVRRRRELKSNKHFIAKMRKLKIENRRANAGRAKGDAT